ncbi:MAG: hypothetical protein OEN01_03670 [Candidatus Krumholzibacteria bacterium]|nr:hypothetical protein [Candidatus Krumholzibacteria bacterium]
MNRVLVAILCTLIAGPGAFAKKTTSEGTAPRFASTPHNEPPPPDVARHIRGLSRSQAAPADTFLLASFSFDGPGGGGDAQGWASVDLTRQIDEFFHVADAGELDGGQFGRLAPLEGDQSMWCGVSPTSDPVFCRYASLPGYGNGWGQSLTSDTFYGDSIRICYRVAWDSELDYDWTRVQYLDRFGGWTSLQLGSGVYQYDGVGSADECLSIAVPAESTRVRFHFTSDCCYSDEDGSFDSDGAVIVDSIRVECYAGGVLTHTFYEDFEDESPGAKTTDDGVWTAHTTPVFGDYAALYPGITVLQEDPCVSNITSFWAWFDDPVNSNYGCAGHPEQGAIPKGDANCNYINSQIESLLIPFAGSGNEVRLRFLVYRDLPLDNLVFFTWAVRSWVDGCPTKWRDSDLVYYGGQKDWLRTDFSIGDLIEPNASHIQVAVGVFDGCPLWCLFGCSSVPEGSCRSGAPYIDNVSVERIDFQGPQFSARHLDLFQDSFAQDGTLTGFARADAAGDILPTSNPGILPGDSVSIRVSDPDAALTTDPFTGAGPSVYAFVTVLPPHQPGKTGADVEAPETRSLGKRYPLVDSLAQDGTTWYVYRMDTVLTSGGLPVADKFCFDLNDAVFTPGDTIRYVFAATNTNNATHYFSRRFAGQGEDFITDDVDEALASPMEFTILPSSGGGILYVDDADDRGGSVPTQLYFDLAFQVIGIDGITDRYDVLAPSSNVGNSLASRVKNVSNQIVGRFNSIIWSSGGLDDGLIGDGSGNPEKSDDFALLFAFLDQHADSPGLFITGDSNAEEWATLSGVGAVSLESSYMNFNLLGGDHLALGEPLSPTLYGVSQTFTHAGMPDEFVAYGGCPAINNFDVLQPTGLAQADLVAAQSGNAYLISQETPNSAGSTARVVLSGFSIHQAHDTGQQFPMARAEILRDVLIFLSNVLPTPTGIEATPRLTDYLAHNHPNPFNPETIIRYGIKRRGAVSLRIYNAGGQLVKTLVDGVQTPRPEGFTVKWMGDADSGEPVASGVYFYRLVTKYFEQTKKMVLIK